MVRTSKLEKTLWLHLMVMHKAHSIPLPKREYKFCEHRKWRSDFCWPEHKLIVEVEGGVWSNGRHTRGKGFLADMEKYNTATLMGYKLLRVADDHIQSGQAICWILEALNIEKNDRMSL